MPARAMGDDGPAAGDELLKSANLEAGRSGERKEGGGSKWGRRDGANLTPTRACSACGAGGGMVVLTGERTEQLGAIPDFPVFCVLLSLLQFYRIFLSLQLSSVYP